MGRHYDQLQSCERRVIGRLHADGRLALEHGGTVISHESIYRYVYHQSAQKNWLHRLLPRHKSRRGRIARGGDNPVSFIKHRRPITERPSAAEDRARPGHWEADLMLFAKARDILLVACERSSRMIHLLRQPNRTARTTRDHLARILRQLPDGLRRSLTLDNGVENTLHHQLPIDTFFCDTHAPWQKGGVENAVGRLRRALPRRKGLDGLTKADIDEICQNDNNTPRKCLGYRTPAEVYKEILNPVALET